MAINIQTFKTRALTALVFVIVMLSGLLINGWSFMLLYLFIMTGCLYEFAKILFLIKGKKAIYFLPLAFIYIVMPVFMMIDLGISGKIFLLETPQIVSNEFYYSALLPCAILFSIWINDTMAYLVGSFIGKTAFSKISPKKTWEGTIGGALLCIVVITVAGYYIPVAKIISWQHWMAIATICAVFGTLGDLLESKLKRMADIKDSGSFMPGHGGFLDRFDSLLVATAFVWLYLKLIFLL